MANKPDDTLRQTRRPRVICRMATSLDGRIVVDGWPSAGDVRKEYEQVHASCPGATHWASTAIVTEADMTGPNEPTVIRLTREELARHSNPPLPVDR